MALGEDVAVGHPADRPRGAFAGLDLGDVALLEIFLAVEHRRDELASLEHEVEVLLHAALVLPRALVLAVDRENHRQAGQQVGLRADKVLELAERNIRRVEILGIRPQTHRRSSSTLLDALAL